MSNSLWDSCKSLLFYVYCATVILIVTKQSWGRIPWIYVNCIVWIQRIIAGKSVEDNNNQDSVCVEKRHLTPDLQDIDGTTPFDISIELLTNGIESILQDDISRPFTWASTSVWTGLDIRLAGSDLSKSMILFYSIGWMFRWCFLLPLRFMLLITSVVFVIGAAVFSAFSTATKGTKMYLGVTFARLFNAATGLVCKAHNLENRPQTPGIGISNHLSAHDIMILYANCDYDGAGFTATGQLHGGFIDTLQKSGSQLTPTLWLERTSSKDRAAFQQHVQNYSNDPDKYPVLLFPEAFCTNNTTVLQFRKAMFDGKVPIYPIAIRQDARLGDSFWKEDTYIPYLLRILTSWAIVYDVYYLPPMYKTESECSTAFAARVQRAIAQAAGCDAIPIDGILKRPEERRRLQQKIQKSLAFRIFPTLIEE